MRNGTMILITLLTFSCGAPMGNVEEGKKGDTVKPAGSPRLEPATLVGSDGTRFDGYGYYWDTQRREICQVAHIGNVWACVSMQRLGDITPEQAKNDHVTFEIRH